MRRIVLGLLVLGVAHALHSTTAHAEGPVQLDDRWPVRTGGRLTIDGGVMLALPAALGTGLSTGVGAGAMVGRRFRLGLRVAGSTASESSIDWAVTHTELRLRAAADFQHVAGRGAFGIRLGVGPTIVHETRDRNQAARAGLTGSAAQTTAFSTLPSIDLDAVVGLHIAGPWLLMLSGGPSASWVSGDFKAGWSALIGTGWQP
jgi:hypothetical protein